MITAFQGSLRRAAHDHLAAVEHDQAAERGRLDAQLSTVWTSDDATESVVRDVAAMRASPSGRTAAYVTGEAGFAADQAAALEGIDETLLIARSSSSSSCCC